ncbi:Armadillo/beta-catenin/plakoglobin [Rhodotorula diobovata]|uniref:uracil phosphoribosyltransferase n=1 Tax=Rhodotorula diobovata TaxID=5288 RepID=A0A5C5FW28_9BASI|nr:Armadillo/beta-catenin/plakoglobin [Rhodotorula diobovata]
MSVNVLSHPVVQAKLSELRDARTSSHRFRALVKELSTVLGIEASRNLPVKDVPGVSPTALLYSVSLANRPADLTVSTRQLKSPIAPFTGKAIAPRVGLTPILRAGIGMTDPMLDLFPEASVFYLGLFREKVSLQPVEYYQKLPATVTVDTLFLLDPLIATGGTAIAAISILQLDWGLDISQIKLLSILGSRPGLQKVAEAYPGLEIYACAVDDEVRLSPRAESLPASFRGRT